jgi:hypothetical protein
MAKEVTLWKAGHDPLLFAERRLYLKAIQDALAGAEAARVVLAGVVKRLERQPSYKLWADFVAG